MGFVSIGSGASAVPAVRGSPAATGKSRRSVWSQPRRLNRLNVLARQYRLPGVPAGSTAVKAVFPSLNHFPAIRAPGPKLTPLPVASTPVEPPTVSVDLLPTTATAATTTTTTRATATHRRPAARLDQPR